MSVKSQLTQFYHENNIPLNELEEDQKWFYLNFSFFKMKFPNPKWRKKVLHIHDIHHLLTGKNTSWKGEAYITGWEIATHLWLKFPVGIFIWLATSYTLIFKPLSLFNGFKEGLKYKGPITINKSKDEFLEMDLDELNKELKVYPDRGINLGSFLYFLLACLWSVLFSLSPFILTLLLIFFLN